jgi:hypothetical protein
MEIQSWKLPRNNEDLEKILERSGRGLMAILSWTFPAGAEEAYEEPQPE